VLGLVGQPIRFRLIDSAAPALNGTEQLISRCTFQTLELFHRHNRSKRPTSSFDDELVVPKGNTIEHIAQSLANFQR